MTSAPTLHGGHPQDGTTPDPEVEHIVPVHGQVGHAVHGTGVGAAVVVVVVAVVVGAAGVVLVGVGRRGLGFLHLARWWRRACLALDFPFNLETVAQCEWCLLGTVEKLTAGKTALPSRIPTAIPIKV